MLPSFLAYKWGPPKAGSTLRFEFFGGGLKKYHRRFWAKNGVLVFLEYAFLG